MGTYAKLRTDLVSSSTEVDGATVFNVKDPLRGTYFRLREPEHWLIHQLDGVTSYADLAERFREKYGFELKAENVEQFVDALEKLYFLENSRSEQILSRTSIAGIQSESLFSRLLFVKLKAVNPGRFLDFLTRLYRPWHSLPGFAFQALIILVGLGVLFSHGSVFALGIYSIFNLASIATVILSFFILVFLHEFAHAVVCRYYGGEVTEMGFLLMYFQPCFYCDVSDAWLFKEKKQRLAVTLAGPYFQLVLVAIAAIVWRVTVPGYFINDVARIVTIVSSLTLLFNLNPLIKLDGYYLLSDYLEIPSLRAKAFDYASAWLKARLLGWPVEMPKTTRRERTIFAIYALLAVIYSVLLLGWTAWWVGGFIMDQMGTAGLLLFVGVVLITLRGSLWGLLKGTVKHVGYMKQILKKPLRLAAHIAVVVTVILLLFVVPFNQKVTGEITVRPISKFELQVNDLGMLERRLMIGGADPSVQSSFMQMTSTEMATLNLRPIVSDGQSVEQGDTVAVLLSNQITNDLEAARALLERLRHRMDLLKAPPKKEEVAKANSALSAAEASVNQLQRDLDLVVALRERSLSTVEQLEEARAALAVAKANQDSRRAELKLLESPPKPEEEAVLQSEINGQLARLRFLESQEAAQSVVSPIKGKVSFAKGGSRLLDVIDESRIELLIPVRDFDLNLVQLGQTVRTRVRTYTDRIFEGEVVHIPVSAAVTEFESFYQVAAEIDNSSHDLREGMTGYAKITIRETSLFSLIARKFTSFLRVEFWSWW